MIQWEILIQELKGSLNPYFKGGLECQYREVVTGLNVQNFEEEKRRKHLQLYHANT